MTPQELEQKLAKVKTYLATGLPQRAGVEAKRHFERSFHDEGFTDERLVKWPNVKRRTNPPPSQVGKASSKRKILTGETGDLGSSLDWNVEAGGPPRGEVKVTTDVPYAQVHNEGGQAGRGHKARIPKRQFMGNSKKLIEKLETIVEADLSKIFNA